MAVDTPATIAILGAGPIGLEAALYARFLGYDAAVFERGEVGANIRRWGHVRLFSPFGLNRSTLGLAALQAHDAAWVSPADDELLTGREFLDRYLLPLAGTDLLADRVHTGREVVAISRGELLKHELVGAEERSGPLFRLLIRDAAGREEVFAADVVLDCGGVFSRHNHLGPGGAPAIGELAHEEQIEYGLPDIFGADGGTYAGRRTLVIGGGYSAATNVVALADLARTAAGTNVVWLTRRPVSSAAGPMSPIENDPLTQRDRLARRANELAAAGRVGDPAAWEATRERPPVVAHLPGTIVEAIARQGERFVIRTMGAVGTTIEVDRIIANVGFRPDHRPAAELQLHTCYATDGPMRLAAALQGQASRDCLASPASDAAALITPEPDYYILGAKSYGRDSRFLIAAGLRQVRDLFTILGDRPGLDLYANMARTP